MTVPVIAGIFVANETRKAQQNAFENLSTIAQLKTLQIENWLERNADGEILVKNSALSKIVETMQQGENADARAEARELVINRLKSTRATKTYYRSISLFSVKGVQLLNDGQSHPSRPDLAIAGSRPGNRAGVAVTAQCAR